MKKKKLEGEDNSKKKYRFNLIEVIIIMIITSICSITTTIVVSYAINKTSKTIKIRSDLAELIDVYDSISNEYYDSIDKKKIIGAAIEGMIGELDDPYSMYLNDEASKDYEEDLEGKYVGIGVKIKQVEKKIVVVEVFKNSPAEEKGIKKDDIILSIDDKLTSDVELSKLPNLIRGKENTKVKLVIQRNSKKIDVEVTRKKIDIESVSYKLIKNNNKKIALISINNFASNTYEQFKNIIDLSKKDEVEGLILDLRNNTGGYLSSAKSIASMFIKKGDIIYSLSSKDKVEKIINDKEPIISTKTVVLTNSYTASASEILTAALKDNLKVDVVGTKTYGKGKVQKIKRLTDGSIIKYTIQNWLTPLGEEIDKKGIIPTVEVELSKKYIENPVEGNDNQLRKAIEVIDNNSKK